MRAWGVAVLATVVACGAVLSSVNAQPATTMQPPTTRVADCTISGCHTAQVSKQFLHGPNAVKACDACHDNIDPSKHKFQLKRQGRDLCEFCHIDKSGTEGPVVHKPVAQGECVACHDPHGSNNRKMLKKDTTPELCTQCHKQVLGAAHAHKPAGDDCTLCHKAHTSANEKLLTMNRRDLCLSCHQDVANVINGTKHAHNPVKGDCLQCHMAHGSDEVKNLKAAPKDLCLSCHQKVATTISECKRGHSAATDGAACLNCHVPHGSDSPKQLTKDPVASCMQCHQKPIVMSKERSVKAVTELADKTMHRHGPIDKGDCASCHAVHGGERDRLLVANYSTTFYQPYSDGAYELCMKCHDKGLVLSQPSTTQTNFRNGERNLHAVHVNSGTQGRNCRACHAIHASKSKALINNEVDFGQWKLPINFEATETGGSCAPGCHRVEKYDRASPVLSKPQSPPPVKPPAAGDPVPAVPAGK